jgi:hypothetical protein
VKEKTERKKTAVGPRKERERAKIYERWIIWTEFFVFFLFIN